MRALEAAMDRFVSRENIKRYRKLVSASTDAAERLQIMKLLAEEEAKFKAALGRRDDALGGQSSVNTATVNRFE